jgi:hypothetical protein
MAARHHRTMEIGGWVLLASAISLLLYLLFHGDSMSGGTAVTSRIVASPPGTGKRPTITLDDPSKPARYTDESGTIWLWDPIGKQWFLSDVQGSPN